MAVLYGWSLSSFYGVDHTYVTSSDGHIWNCWGRSSGGTIICSGEAIPGIADCISQKKSRAGLIYGITGVCHQTANRILLPAGCIVSKAKNYWITAFVYGTYGVRFPSSLLSFNKRIARCSQETTGLPENLTLEGFRGDSERLYLQRINSMYNHYMSMYRDINALQEKDIVTTFLHNELRLTMDYRLGNENNVNNANKLINYQSELLQEKKPLDDALLKKSLSTLQYARRINDLVNGTFKEISKVLGDQNYAKLFGLAPHLQLEIIDPEIMAGCNIF